MKIKLFRLLFWIVGIFCTSFFILLSRLPSEIRANTKLGNIVGLPADGWIYSGLNLKINGLYGRGNRLVLTTNSEFRPIESGPAQILIKVCDKVVTQLSIPYEVTQNIIYLTGSCKPIQVTFEVLNPFSPGDHDLRALGVIISGIKFESRLGAFPIPNIEEIFLISVAMALGTYGLFLLVGGGFNHILGISILSIAMLFAPAGDLSKVILWLAITGLFLIGFFKYKNTIGNSEENSEQNNKYSETLSIISIFSLAILLRFWGLDFGLPYIFHPDEVPKLNAVKNMMLNGDLNPRYFLHPSLLLYLSYFGSKIVQIFSPTTPIDMSIILGGRFFSALFGAMTCSLVYKLGKLLFNNVAGYVAGILLAVFPLHVTCSRYVKEDALLVFWFVAVTYTVAIIVIKKRATMIPFAAFLCGITCSAKYTGILSIGILLGAPWLATTKIFPDKTLLKWCILSLPLVALGFVLFTPYSLFDYNHFINHLTQERDHMIRGHTFIVSPWSEWWLFHIRRSLFTGITPLVTGIFILAIGATFRKGIKDNKALWILILCLAFYLPAEWVNAKPEPQPERYILPVLPPLAVLCGWYLTTISYRYRWVLAATLFLPPLLVSANLAYNIKPDSREIAAEWMKNHLPKNSKILMFWKPYAPSLDTSYFNVTFASREDALGPIQPEIIDNSNFDYIVLSSLFFERYYTHPDIDPAYPGLFNRLFSERIIAAEFTAPLIRYGFHNPSIIVLQSKKRDNISETGLPVFIQNLNYNFFVF